MARDEQTGSKGKSFRVTPHVSGWTEGMMDARAGVIAENIHRAARGEAPLNHIR